MRGQNLHEWRSAAIDARADVVQLGDSNQLYAGYGWDAGFIRAFRSRVGIYSTGLLWCGENNGQGQGMGDGFSTINGATGVQFSGAPPEADVFGRFYNSSSGSNYIYLASGSITGIRQWGVAVSSTGLDTRASLRWLLSDVTFPDAGSFRPIVRIGQSPYTVLHNWGPVSTQSTGGYSVRTSSFTLSADANRVAPLEFRYAPFGGGLDVVAPFMGLWSRVEQVDAPGVAVHTLYAVGGRSARFMAATLNGASNEMLTAYFADVRRTTPEGRRILVRMNQGLNDRNETEPSVGTGILPGNSPAAFADNIEFSMDRIREIWTINGWPQDELVFVVSIAFAVSTPQQQILIDYRNAAIGLRAEHPDLTVVDLSRRISNAQMESQFLYATSIDRNHLANSGYNVLSGIEVDALLTCPSDIDTDGDVDSDDVIAFFGDWDAGETAGDIDFDRDNDVDDIATFFSEWDGGC